MSHLSFFIHILSVNFNISCQTYSFLIDFVEFMLLFFIMHLRVSLNYYILDFDSNVNYDLTYNVYLCNRLQLMLLGFPCLMMFLYDSYITNKSIHSLLTRKTNKSQISNFKLFISLTGVWSRTLRSPMRWCSPF